MPIPAEPMPTHTDTTRDEILATGRERALELAEADAPLEESLGELVRTIERASDHDVLGSILVLSDDGEQLLHGAAPSLPPAYCDAIHGLRIGPTVGSCGTAAFSGNTVMVRDVATDPLWIDFKDLALAHGLRACWSMPIRSPRGRILGTFALYHRFPTAPTITARTLVDRLGATAAEIILRFREQHADTEAHLGPSEA